MPTNNAMPQNKIVVSYGEVLWDIFKDGKRAGGAPFNAVYNMKKMGLDSYMISRVGDDELGGHILQKIKAWGIPVDSLQIDPQYPTGTVIANIGDNNEAQYDIIRPVAWDFITYRPEDAELVSRSAAFVFGSLATRNEVSRNTLLKLVEYASYKVFDINLRAPFIDIKTITELMEKSDLVKVNKAELRQVIAWLGREFTTEEDAMKLLREKYHLKEVLVTKGSKGAVYLNDDGFFRSSVIKVDIMDTVGSGDSFLAGFLSGRMLELNPKNQPLYNACTLGAFITNHRGACPDYTLEEFNAFKEKHPAHVEVVQNEQVATFG
ncbi:MAG: carbohydrate kinase [Chitinophagaceae bacterium]